MDGDASTFTGSIPSLYDEHLVPFFFAPYAREMTARIVRLQPSSILELAAGTGVVTGELARALPEASIVATDLSEPMLERAREKHARPNVTFARTDAMALPFPDGRFDAIVCQFGVMFFSDRTAAFREALRVLAPGGTYLCSVWAALEDNDAARIVSKVVAEAFPADPPTFLRRLPYGHGDPVAIERDLRAAGFGSVACDDVVERSVADDGARVARGLLEGSPLRDEILARDADALPRLATDVGRALVTALGEPLDGAQRALVFTARR